MADDKNGAANDLVTVSDWDACYNSDDAAISLSCKVITNDSSPGISGVGIMLNDSKGIILASTYVALSGGCESVTPALNLPPGGLTVGDTVWGVVSGEVEGQHYFFEEELSIGTC